MIYVFLALAIGLYLLFREWLPHRNRMVTFVLSLLVSFAATTLIKIVTTNGFSGQLIFKGYKASEMSEEEVEDMRRNTNMDIETIREFQKTGAADIPSPFECINIAASRKIAEFIYPITDLTVKDEVDQYLNKKLRERNSIENIVPSSVRSTIVYVICIALGETLAVFIPAAIMIIFIELVGNSRRSTSRKVVETTA